MKYTPENFEWEPGDVVASDEFYQVAIRTGHNEWCNSLCGYESNTYNDQTITDWIKSGKWNYMGHKSQGKSYE